MFTEDLKVIGDNMKHTSVVELIAVSPNNQLWKCSCCYQTHLMIGKVSLRMTCAEVEELTIMLSEVIDRPFFH
ncbi:MAG: hypothetical protein CMK36_01875 [Porticoccaceae bacterium]|nr:hypothetical protein [Porticoccaceae bacterium]